MKKTAGIVILISLLTIPSLQARGDYHTFGLQAGLSFPKVIFGKADVNFSENFGADYQVSWGFFWSIQQLDALYFFRRSDWSPYVGAGAQFWNFFGFNTQSLNGLAFTGSSQATAMTVPAGLLYVADSGFALDLCVALDLFVNAPSGLQNKVIPEGQISVGYFF